MKKKNVLNLTDVEFTINPATVNGCTVTYSKGEPICITEIGRSYDFIIK